MRKDLVVAAVSLAFTAPAWSQQYGELNPTVNDGPPPPGQREAVKKRREDEQRRRAMEDAQRRPTK